MIRGLILVSILIPCVHAEAQAPDAGPKFGPEFTVYDPNLLTGKPPDIEKFLKQANYYLGDFQPNGSKFEITNGSYVSPNGWHFNVKPDQGVLEINTNPMTAEDFEKYGPDMQDAIFVTAANVGLFPGLFVGGGHISIDLEYLRNRPRLYRNFVADILVNHVELFMGVFGFDTNNALPAQLIQESTMWKIIGELEKFDNSQAPTRESSLILEKALSNIGSGNLVDDQYVRFWRKHSFRSHKYRSVYFNGVKLELRGVRPQASMDVWIRQIRLLRNRMRYLESLEAPTPLGHNFNLTGRFSTDPVDASVALTPPITAMEALENFKIFAEQAGEKIEDHLDYVWPAWHSDGSVEKFKTKYGLHDSLCAQLLGPTRSDGQL